MKRVWKNYIESSDLDPEIYMVVTKKYATLIELDRDYSVPDLMDLLEIIDIENDLEYAKSKDQEQMSKQRK